MRKKNTKFDFKLSHGTVHREAVKRIAATYWKHNFLNWLDFEVESNERKDQTFQVLYEIVERSQTLGILALVDVNKWANFWRGEADVVIAQDDLKLLATNSIWSGPHVVVFPQNLRIFDDALQLW